jgi:DUF4097 and DUF4098 domain-containing protein YvlB
MIKQSVRKFVRDKIDRAEHYYAVLSAVNDLELTRREIQLVAFTAINGSISARTAKDRFCNRYDTTVPTINNIISKLKKKSIFVKTGKIVKVNPLISLDFSKGITLIISMENEAS